MKDAPKRRKAEKRSGSRGAPKLPRKQDAFVIEYLTSHLDVDRMIDKLKTFEQWMNSTSEADKEQTRRAFGDLKAFYDKFANGLNELKRECSTEVRHGS